MERLPIEVLDNSISVYKTTLEAFEGKDTDYCPSLDRVTVQFLEELKEYRRLEEQGLIVKIPCHCNDCKHWIGAANKTNEHVKLCTVSGYMVGENGYCVYAERKE